MATETMKNPQAATNGAGLEQTRTKATFLPNVDIFETPQEIQLLADIPGAKGEEIDIDFDKGALTIHARVEPRQPEGGFLLREYGVGDFNRTFQVSEKIDASRITAEYRDGVLTLHLPKVEAAQARKITVSTA